MAGSKLGCGGGEGVRTRCLQLTLEKKGGQGE